MAIENDILKTLQGIEKLLKSASGATSDRATQTFSSRINKLRGKDEPGKDKVFKSFATNVDKTNDALSALQSNLSGLNKEVGKTASGFGVLNQKMAKFISSLGPVQQASPAPPQAAPTGRAAKGKKTKASAPASATERTPASQITARLLENFGQASAGAGGVAAAFGHVITAARKLAGEYFDLAEMGLGSVSNLVEFSKNALMSGMALKEYTALIGSSINVAARAGSLANFHKIISANDAQLATMGVFGAEARAMQASLAQSSASLGIPITELTKATASQIDIFDKLRKSSNMTASEFAQMARSVANSEDAQKELLGLAPQERMARMNQLIGLQSIGTKMGMTAEASKKLGDALMAQRQATVKERIDQAGVLLQMGAFTGNGAAGARGAALEMKGRRRSSAEEQEYLAITQQLERSAQTMYENGSLGVQNTLDRLAEQRSKGAGGQVISAGRGLSLAEDTGKVNQEAFGQHVGEFGQAVGKITALFNGFEKSILGPALIGIGGALAAVIGGPLALRLAGSIRAGTVASKGGPGMLTRAGKAVEGGITAAKSGAKAVGGALTAGKAAIAANGIGAFSSAFQSVMPGLRAAFEGGSQIMRSGGTLFLNGIKSVTKLFGPLAGIFDAAIEMFTGSLTTALNPSGGIFDRMGGMATAFFTAIPNFLIDIFSYVFGDSAGTWVQNKFDTLVALVNGTMRLLFGKIFESIADVLKWVLPDDSKLVKNLESWGKGAQDSATENFDTMGKLYDDNKKTLSSISADNAKTAEDATKTTSVAAEATTKATAAKAKFNVVQDANTVSASTVKADALAFATPQVQVAKQVAPPAVNTPQAAPAAQNSSSETQKQIDPSSDMSSLLTSILQVLRDSLVAENLQVENSNALIKLSKPGVSFQSSEQNTQMLLRRSS